MTTHIHVRHVGGPNHALKIAGDGGVQAELQPGQSTDIFVHGEVTFTEIPLETAQDEAPVSFSLQTIGQGITGDEPIEHPAAAQTEHVINTSESIMAAEDATVENKTYADGTEATGVAPLPDQSPAGAPAVDLPSPPGAGLTEPAAQ